MFRWGCAQKGITLIEMLLVALMMTLIVGSVVILYSTAGNAIYIGYAQFNLYQQASLTMEQMVRGVAGYGRNGIRESNSVTLPDSVTIQYTSGRDGKERSFYLDGNEIMYVPDTSIAGGEFPIAEGVNSLTFTVTGKIVTIDLNMQMQDSYKGRDMPALNAELSTCVLLRN